MCTHPDTSGGQKAYTGARDCVKSDVHKMWTLALMPLLCLCIGTKCRFEYLELLYPSIGLYPAIYRSDQAHEITCYRGILLLKIQYVQSLSSFAPILQSRSVSILPWTCHRVAGGYMHGLWSFSSATLYNTYCSPRLVQLVLSTELTGFERVWDTFW